MKCHSYREDKNYFTELYPVQVDGYRAKPVICWPCFERRSRIKHEIENKKSTMNNIEQSRFMDPHWQVF